MSELGEKDIKALLEITPRFERIAAELTDLGMGTPIGYYPKEEPANTEADLKQYAERLEVYVDLVRADRNMPPVFGNKLVLE